MDKPLSQERLSEGDLANHIGWLAIGLDSKGYERLQIIVNEIKRLQAIEQQNIDLTKLLTIIDFELNWGDAENAIDRCKALIRKITEGAVNHE